MQDILKLPLVGITMGDPAGIGPEVTLKALGQVFRFCRPVILGDLEVLEETAQRLGLAVPLAPWSPDQAGFEKGYPVFPLSRLSSQARNPGRPTPEGGEASYRYVEEGVRLAQRGLLHALVTAPIHKAMWHAAGHPYAGHTECLAALTGASEVRMMLMGRSLRVILVTTHLPLAEVPKVLSVEKITQTFLLAHDHLKRFHGLSQPRLALAALNPHAGEGGAFGTEEARILAPAVEAARQRGVAAEGPFPADSLFVQALRGAFDGVVCLYHDQGLIPLKLLAWEEGVNVTLGLPIIRTSPDHGTAYDIAGQGRADPASMVAAIVLATEMVQREQG